jgi:hypothetical protein
MEKGLCFNCLQDKECSFNRRFPVFFCEEFAIGTAGINGKAVVKPAKACVNAQEELVD